MGRRRSCCNSREQAEGSLVNPLLSPLLLRDHAHNLAQQSLISAVQQRLHKEKIHGQKHVLQSHLTGAQQTIRRTTTATTITHAQKGRAVVQTDATFQKHLSGETDQNERLSLSPREAWQREGVRTATQRASPGGEQPWGVRPFMGLLQCRFIRRSPSPALASEAVGLRPRIIRALCALPSSVVLLVPFGRSVWEHCSVHLYREPLAHCLAETTAGGLVAEAQMLSAKLRLLLPKDLLLLS